MQRKIFAPHEWSLQNFKVGRRLGKGQYGKVYLVKQKPTQMIFALKLLSKKIIEKHVVISQIRREIEIHSHLNHENILSMYGYFYDEDNIYIMMEYAVKGDLFRAMQLKIFDQNTVKIYMKQMVDAVHYLQSMNIIHRDIKPENIMVTGDNNLKLSDFGWAIKTKSSSRYTFCGTPDYFCPQIVNYIPFDYKIDNWSLGILAYELLIGKTPFHDNDENKMFRKIVESEIEFPKWVSEGFRDFVTRLIQKDPKERMELSDALKHPWLSSIMDIEGQRQKEEENSH